MHRYGKRNITKDKDGEGKYGGTWKFKRSHSSTKFQELKQAISSCRQA
jgi:hypothetical protein